MIIPRYSDLGKAEAENDDEYFSDCFVDTGLLENLLARNNSASIVVGRTGSGKSALIRRIHETEDRVVELKPENLSLGYLADSWLLQFLTENQFDLNLFYQQLWRHVLVVELLKYHEDLRTRNKVEMFLGNLRTLFRDNAGKIEALAYLEKYGGDFWSDTDERVKRITDDFEEQVGKEAGAAFQILSAKYRRGEKIGRHETKELVSTAQRIVSSVQMQKLANMVDILDQDIFSDRMRRTVLVIDDLDTQWTDDRVRLKLIEALIHALPKFRRVRNVRIVVAMRDDLLDTVLAQATTAGFQRDKFQDYHTRLSWKKFELKDMIDKRVNLLFKRKYTKVGVKLDDLFSEQKSDGAIFDYVTDRTLLRPRDILAYFNMIFDRCAGRAKISLKDVRSVEFDYSQSRRNALVDEWKERYPFIEHCLAFLGDRRLSAQFRIGALNEAAIDKAATNLYADHERSELPLVQFARAHFEDNSDQSRQRFTYRLIQVLYQIGALGLRTQENSRPQFAFLAKPSVSVDELSDNTWCIVHPMLWQSLGRRGDLQNLFQDQ